MTGLPRWWQPLRARAARVTQADFGGFRTPGEGARASAVLVLLGEDGDGQPDVLLLRRAGALRHHAGQIAFPGGAADPTDVDAVATALREAGEEVGVDPAGVRVAATLPPLWIPVSNFRVTPVLAWWWRPNEVAVNDHGEVAGVARHRLADLAAPENRVLVRGPDGRVGPGFRSPGGLVWGFTGAVLSTVLELGDWAMPWAADRIEDLPGTRNPPVR